MNITIQKDEQSEKDDLPNPLSQHNDQEKNQCNKKTAHVKLIKELCFLNLANNYAIEHIVRRF